MKITVEEMQRFVAGELSLRSRIAYTALLLAALGMTILAGSLWLTEPSLPVRTQIAFAAMVAIGLSWVAYASWVLTRKRVLLAGHRVIATRMAIAFSALFVLGSALIRQWPATALGAVMLVVAIAMLIGARRRFAQLTERRRELEQQLQQSAGVLAG